MKKSKTFIAISSETFKDKLVYLNTSGGVALFDEKGISFNRALDFLFNLIHKRDNKTGVVFVCYAFSRDNEFIFSTMPSYLKDKLFLAHTIKNEIENLELELEQIEDKYYSAPLDSQDFELADFERYVNQSAIKDLTEVRYKDYFISLRNGKVLTIRKGGRSISIYDIYGFFQKSLRKSVKQWLDKDIPLLDRKIFNQCYGQIEQLRVYSDIEVTYISELITKVNNELVKYGLNLSRYQGAGAVSSHILSLLQAKKSFHHYRYKRQISSELNKAVFQSMYGGRAEQFKIGTLNKVKVYDINSAYGYAISFLPVLLSKPLFVSEWQPEPFSLFFCEYDFFSVSPYIGYLPNRSVRGLIQYKTKGKGYFWQPEVSFILNHFPQCIDIKHGFVLGYEQAPFAKGIETIYELRKILQADGNPLADIIKLALSGMYGKFAQYHGKGHFYNPFYAGFITSFVRAMLLEAVKFHERSTICFQTDAIHTTAKLPVSVSDNFGEYKLSEYDKIRYLDNGIYQAFNNGKPVKEKTRGFRAFDFNGAFKELSTKKTYSALWEFFIGHNLSVRNMFGRHNYLTDYKTTKYVSPVSDERIEKAIRLFEVTGVDLTRGYLNSKIVPFYNGMESSIYRQQENKAVDCAIDTIQAARI